MLIIHFKFQTEFQPSVLHALSLPVTYSIILYVATIIEKLQMQQVCMNLGMNRQSTIYLHEVQQPYLLYYSEILSFTELPP